MTIRNRRIVNIGWDTSAGGGTHFITVPLNLTFKPNKVVVRSYSYDTADNTIYQVGTNLVSEGILFSFVANITTVQLHIPFRLYNFPQSNAWTFQIQSIPTGTGNGPQTNGSSGVISFILEFLDEDE
jgi:hypothetical protein